MILDGKRLGIIRLDGDLITLNITIFIYYSIHISNDLVSYIISLDIKDLPLIISTDM